MGFDSHSSPEIFFQGKKSWDLHTSAIVIYDYFNTGIYILSPWYYVVCSMQLMNYCFNVNYIIPCL